MAVREGDTLRGTENVVRREETFSGLLAPSKFPIGKRQAFHGREGALHTSLRRCFSLVMTAWVAHPAEQLAGFAGLSKGSSGKIMQGRWIHVEDEDPSNLFPLRGPVGKSSTLNFAQKYTGT